MSSLFSKKKNQTSRMTEGSEVKLLLRFMLPLLMGNIFQQIYTMVDSIVVGRFVSSVALGSVGTVSSITFLFLSLCIGLSGGVNVLVAQYFGAGKTANVKQAIGNAVYVTLLTGMTMSILAITLARPILHLMQVPEANFADALLYMRITCGATIVTAIYNTSSQIMCALGDTKTPLICVSVSSVINVVLDLVFVAAFHWGVSGAAWATVISWITATIGAVVIPLRKNEYYQLTGLDLVFSPRIVKKIIRMGIPLALQNAMGSISGVITQGIVNTFGSTVMSAYTACGRVEQILVQPYGTLGVSMASFSAQNIGAGKYDRVRSACRKSIFMVEGFTIAVTAVCFCFGRIFIGMFLTDSTMIEIGYRGLLIIAVSYFATGLVFVFKAMLNGAGDTAFTMFSGIIEIAARVVFLWVLISIPTVGIWGIWITAILSGITAAVLCFARYRQGKWKQRAVI
ncbi:MAG: MATE family efflux transporter [Eubacteriales bacterium]|nr:MATE family efflux transporter [Eubacteriales bacterium]